MFRKQNPAAGSRPGTLVIADGAPRPVIHVMSYSHDDVQEVDVTSSASLREVLDSPQTHWIDIQGLGDETLIREIAELFAVHPLAMEDIVNIPHRPDAQVFGSQLLIVTRMVRVDDGQHVDMEQLSILVGPNYVITFQERPGDILDPVRNRIRFEQSSHRKLGAHYLAYSILDTVVDGYYPVLESIGDYLESLEDLVVANPNPQIMQELNWLKKQLVNMRRVMWPQREAVYRLVHDSSAYFDESVRLYLRDTYDHCLQTSEVIDMYREMVTSLLNTYLSSIANRTNEVMKVLTIMASIFIPLTFMVGVYGMNFEAMPELKVPWAYPLLWVVMVVTAAAMLMYFRRLGWIGDSTDRNLSER
ncbi:MAG: magnesium/cobalt transporter CorA [Planctomycetaceae bacterium]|nr:magnesium/cobalt transporter CorA [Planctomycetaceae bacterium]